VAEKVNFSRKKKSAKKVSSTEFPFEANVSSGKKRRGGFGGGS
jgi:hypothetical protein